MQLGFFQRAIGARRQVLFQFLNQFGILGLLGLGLREHLFGLEVVCIDQPMLGHDSPTLGVGGHWFPCDRAHIVAILLHVPDYWG